MHNSQMAGKKKKQVLSNVRVEWKRRVVMTNTPITASLNLDVKEWFHISYACVSNLVSPREVIQWLSRARYLIEEQVYVSKIPTILPKLITDIMKDDPVFIKLVAFVNTKLHNNA